MKSERRGPWKNKLKEKLKFKFTFEGIVNMKIMIHNIKLVVNNTLQKKHITYSRLTGVIVVSALIFVSLLRPVLASAPLCMDGIMSLQAELDMSFSDRNDPGLHERRNRLRNLFERQTPTCAKKIRRLIDTPSSGGLAKQFQHKLATHTRVELLAVLDKRILATPKVDIDGEIEITTKPTKEQFVRTTRRAKDILNAVNFNNISVSDVEGIRRMKCVIKMMIAEGPSIDDT